MEKRIKEILMGEGVPERAWSTVQLHKEIKNVKDLNNS